MRIGSRLLRLPAMTALAALLLVACGGQPAGQGSPASKPSFAPDSFMAKIQARGKLTAGARQDVRAFGFLNPVTGQTEGFDIDLLRAVAQGIFGSPDAIEFKPVTSANRIPQVKEGAVDIVAATMTITPARRQEIDFSDVYYLAGQKVLVKKDSPIASIKDTGGKRVCAAKGTTSEKNIGKESPTAQLIQLDGWQDCLLAIQTGRADAVSTDDAILASLATQDSSLKVVGPAFSKEPYGLGIAKGHPEFVAFVNTVIADAKKDGRWKQWAAKWLGDYGKALEPPGATDGLS